MRDVELDKELNAYTSWKDKHGGFSKDMTLRDYFAAKAMQAYIGSPDGEQMPEGALADSAYYMADAMLEARK
jgi:hypothetical protein